MELVLNKKNTCCGTDRCRRNATRTLNQTGLTVDSQHRRISSDTETYFECHFEFEERLKCQRVDVLEGHVHGPGCGHEMVSHEDHFDYVVGSRLHHVVDPQTRCCERRCIGEVAKSTVVDHGQIDIRHRASTSTTTLSPQILHTDLHVAGICCQSELPLIHRILEELSGVESVEVTFVTKNVRVKHDAQRVSPALLLSALNGAGLQASLGKREATSDSATESFPFHVLFSGILLAVSIGSLISSRVDWLKYVALGAVTMGSPKILLRGIASLKRLLLDINILMLTACIGAVALGEYVEAGSIIFLFGLAQWLENRCMNKARNAITSLHELQPEFAISACTNETIPVETIMVDDVLVIRPGDRVAVDGIIISGSSSLDESMLTGESRPVMKTEGDVVCSGSVNCGNGSLNVRSTSTVANSTVALLSKKVEEAAVSKSKTDRIIETFAKYYTPTVVFVAVGIAVLPLVAKTLQWEQCLELALVLLVSACPCALVISTPVATICGISSAARLSILIKGGEALEMLSRLKGVSFDKTGTLTRGSFTVISITRLTSISEYEILSLAAELETHSSHPLAAAIIGAAAAKGVPFKNNTENVNTIPGGGLVITKDTINTAGIGNLQMLIELGFSTEDLKDLHRMEEDLSNQGKKACFVGSNGIIIGIIVLADTIRDNAASALRTLASMKLKLALLTGDDSLAAQHVADYVNIPANQVYSKLLPEDKATVLRDLQSTIGAIGHVGDGVNDSIALASADVGIAMGIGGSAIAIDAADVALFSNDLSSIPKAITVSQTVTRVIYQNVAFAIGMKLLVMVLAVLGIVHLWVAVAADMGSSLLVVLNSLRILTRIPKETQKSCCAEKMKKEQEAIQKDVEMQKPRCCANRQCD
eukprot:g8952.t1